MYLRSTLVCLLLAGSLSRCSRPRSSDDVTSVRTALDSLLALHARHFQEGNVDALVEAYTDSAVVRPANMPATRGRDELKSGLAAFLKAVPVTHVVYTTEELAVHGDTAFQINSYVATVEPGRAQMTDHGNCTLLWLRERGAAWRIHRSMCNSRGAPQQASATGRSR